MTIFLHVDDQKLGEPTVKLAETPLKNQLKEAGLDLTLINTRTKAPTSIAFSHLASQTDISGGYDDVSIPERCFAYSSDGQLAIFYRHYTRNKQKRYQVCVTTTRESPARLQSTPIQDEVSQLILNDSGENLEVFLFHTEGENCITVLTQMDTTNLKLSAKASLPRNSLPFQVLRNFALSDEEVVMCSSERKPKLYLWNSKTDGQREVQLNFDKEVEFDSMHPAPNGYVLCCYTQHSNELQKINWYEDVTPTPYQQPKYYLTLINIHNGSRVWQLENKHRYHIGTYSEGFFYWFSDRIIQDGHLPVVEIVDAWTGKFSYYERSTID